MMLPKRLNYWVYEGQALPEAWPYDYVLDGGGVVKRCSTPQFAASLRVSQGRVAGLPWLVAAGQTGAVSLHLPKIPAVWLYRVADHARRAGVSAGAALQPVEQMYHFHWFDDGRGWQVAVPAQTASAGQVRYQGGSAASVVLDLHSHHRMQAYFSQTDNQDEQGCRFYGVMGRLFDQPELRLRLGVYGDFWEVEPGVLFAGRGPFGERTMNNEQ